MTTGLSKDRLMAADAVDAAVDYMKPMDERPVRYLCEPPAGEPEMNWQFDTHHVPIRNARRLLDHLSLEKQGFVVHRRKPPTVDFDNEEQVRATYYPEVEQIVRDLTGAFSVRAFDHNVRSGSKEERRKRGAFPPARNVHADYTLRSGPQRLRDITGHDLPGDGATSVQIINVWRPIRHAVEDDALALCDAESVALSDLVATDLRYVDRTGEFYSVMFSPRHRWYYVPRMAPDEMLVFKCFDSRNPSRVNCVPHVAFHDPDAPLNAAPRESIEVRTMAFFEE